MKKTIFAAVIATGAFAIVVAIADRIESKTYDEYMRQYRRAWDGSVPPSTVG